jgi:hypothetical protein
MIRSIQQVPIESVGRDVGAVARAATRCVVPVLPKPVDTGTSRLIVTNNANHRIDINRPNSFAPSLWPLFHGKLTKSVVAFWWDLPMHGAPIQSRDLQV